LEVSVVFAQECGVFEASKILSEDGVFGGLSLGGRKVFRGFGGLCNGGKMVYSRLLKVFVVDEVFGRLWNNRKKQRNS
jgi:hypothetical protein